MKRTAFDPSCLWGLFGLSALALGICTENQFMLATGSVATVWLIWVLFCERQKKRRELNRLVAVVTSTPIADEDDLEPKANSEDMTVQDLVKSMINDGRYGLLLRPLIAIDLWSEQLEEAREKLQSQMGLIPSGEVELFSQASTTGESTELTSNNSNEHVEFVAAFFLDRHLITNRQFQRFVHSGGYTQTSLWDAEILPAVLDFVDSTGQAGPRWWKNGRYLPHEGDLPVVGVCWYEALAYARWAGKRLPTDAEWVKAASWPVPITVTKRKQRRFPWGDGMEQGRANLWEAGLERIVPVTDFPTGANTSGIQQLIGNVWEWNSTDFRDPQIEEQDVETGTLKTIHGGAYDTYFESQATAQFASADTPFARKHNIGFRCALSWTDVMLGELPPSEQVNLDDPENPEICEDKNAEELVSA